MKNYLCIAIMCIASMSFAQEVNFGIRGGLNLANADFEVSGGGASVNLDTDGRTSFYLGGFAELSLSDSPHKLQTGLTYHANGFKLSLEGDDFTFKVSQLNVPVLFKFMATDGLYLNGGVYAGAIIDVEGEIESGNVTDTQDITDEFNTFDFGLSLGAEYNLENGLFFEARYNYGLANIIDEDDAGFGGTETTLNNRFFTVGLGFKF